MRGDHGLFRVCGGFLLSCLLADVEGARMGQATRGRTSGPSL